MARTRFVDLSISIKTGYGHMEKRASLSDFGRPHGFKICCFPIKIKGTSAAWIRPVALVEEA